MKHLDEGTIHAWLDGALDAVQARETEAHLAQCTTCSAAVAEARGLVAASSRILTALDDVPGGVVPKRTAPMVKPAKRQWRAAPWVSAIAATLILAVGIMRLNRDEQFASFKVADTDSAPVATQPAERAANVAPVVAPAAPGPLAARENESAVRLRSAVTSRQKEQRADSAPTVMADRAVDAVAGAAGGGGAGSPGQGFRREVAAGAPAAAAPAAPLAASEPADQKLEKTAKAAPSAPSAQAPRLALEEMVVTGARDAGTKKSDDAAATELLAGCYRVAASAMQGAAKGVTATVGRAAEARDARRPAAAANFAASAVPDLVRLDTAQRAQGMPVRGAGSDSIVGWWFRVGTDTADVRLLAGVAIRVVGKNRVSCPER